MIYSLADRKLLFIRTAYINSPRPGLQKCFDRTISSYCCVLRPNLLSTIFPTKTRADTVKASSLPASDARQEIESP